MIFITSSTTSGWRTLPSGNFLDRRTPWKTPGESELNAFLLGNCQLSLKLEVVSGAGFEKQYFRNIGSL